jgi:hypothetical protein
MRAGLAEMACVMNKVSKEKTQTSMLFGWDFIDILKPNLMKQEIKFAESLPDYRGRITSQA